MDVIDRVRQSLAPRYEIEDEVGRGGFAIVFKGVDARHHRTVAIKVLNPDLWAGSAAGERFKREIEIVSNLQHPNILPLFDSGDIEGLPYFVMPFVSGESLADRLEREGPLPIQETVSIATDVAQGLGHAHRQGIVHRDIKPANILLFEGRAVIADFGIARALESNPDKFRTATGHAPGTPAYMSPEQVGNQEIDSRADLYSLGCVLFEALSGEPPFTGRTVQAIVARHLREEPPSLEVVRPAVPSGLAEAIRKTLQKVPADRIQSAEELVEALERGLKTQVRGPGWRQRAKRRWQVAVGATGLLAVSVLVAQKIMEPHPTLDNNKVVVFPFVRVGEADPEDSGWDVALSIETALEHNDPYRTIDGREWLPPAVREDLSLLTPELSSQIAIERGAGRYVSGLLLANADSVGVTVRLHEVDGERVPRRETAWGPTGQGYSEVGLSAFEALLPRILEAGHEVDLTPFTDRETGAKALTIQGDRAYRESRFAEAYDFYRRAVEEDSLFAIAASRGATAAIWQEEPRDALALADQAVRHAGALPDRYQHFIRGVQGYLSGEIEVAIQNLEAALEAEPDWPEAAAVLGEAYYHLLPMGVDPVARAHEIFEGLAERYPGFAPPLLHLTDIAIRSNELADAEVLIQRLSTLTGPGARHVVRSTRMLDCVRSGGENPGEWSVLASEDPSSVMVAGLALAAAGAQPLCAEQAFQAVRGVGGQWTWGSVLGLQSLWMAQGRIPEVLALLDEELRAGRGAAFTLYLFDAGISEAFNPGAAKAEEVARNTYGELYRGANGVNLWLMGVWWACQGNQEMPSALAQELKAYYSGPYDRQARMLSAALEAHAALAAGDEDEAVLLLSDLTPTAPLWNLYWEFHEALAPERIRLARSLLAQGEYQQAIQVSSLFDHPAPITYLAYLAPSLEIRMRAAEALGRTDLVQQLRGRMTRLGWPDGRVPLSMTGPLLTTSLRKEAS